MSDDEERVTVRMSRDLVAALDAVADDASTSRSDLMRKGAHFVVETQAERLARQGDLIEQERQQVEENRKRRNIARFPNTVRDLFLEDLKAAVSPEKLPMLADGYRRQARTKETLAQELDGEPVVEPGELVEAVDRELAYALDAADLTNYYDQHDNPYAAKLSGVREGVEEREDLVALVAGLVETHGALLRAFSDPEAAPGIDAKDLPPMASTLLPDRVSEQDVADLASELAREGYTAEQVRDVLDGSAFAGDAIEVEADVEPAEDDLPEATLRKGGVPIDAHDTDENDEPSALATREASDATQAELMQAITAADGGRTPSARRSGYGPEEVDNMSHDNTEADSIEYDDAESAQDRLAMLSEATHEAAENAGGADDE